MDEAKPPRPVGRPEFDQMSEAALGEHADRIQAARGRGILDFAQALIDSFDRADEARRAEQARRRAEWEASPEYAEHMRRVHRNRSEAAKRGWETRREREAQEEREGWEPHMSHPCHQVAAEEGRCAGRRLDLCGSCQEPITPEQIDVAAAATDPGLGVEQQIRAWLTAGLSGLTVTDRMAEAAAQASARFDMDLMEYQHLIEREGAEPRAYRLAGAVLHAAWEAKDLPPLPDLGEGPRVHAYTPTDGALRMRYLMGNLTPTRYELLTADGVLEEQDAAAPTEQAPPAARRLLAAAHAAGLSWDLYTVADDQTARLVVRGLDRPSSRDVWVWRKGRLDRVHTTGRPLREALAALTTEDP
jgi:hypothetical protein